MTNSVRNSAMPVSTVLGGDICMPSAFRVSDNTTMILVKEVASSSTAGATDSTVIARMSVIEVLGLPPPMEMSTPPSTAGTTGAVGAVGSTGAVGAADAGPASSASTDRKSTRLNSSHANISYAVFCLKKKKRPL